jgi:hypothetical protein
MRIYSNTLLSKPIVFHIFQANYLYPGQLLNYYVYRVEMREPVVLLQYTYSPIELLKENNKFYCYEHYQRNQYLEQFDNKLEMGHIQHSEPTFTENYIYVPERLSHNDIIVITPFSFKTPVGVTKKDLTLKPVKSTYLPSLPTLSGSNGNIFLQKTDGLSFFL